MTFFSHHRWLASFLIVASFVAACFLLLGLPFFETNDDFTMAAISSGIPYAEDRDDHILFSHFFVGAILSGLFSAAPSVPWYGLYLHALQIISMTVIVWIVSAKFERPGPGIGIACGALIITCMRPLLSMQFTTTAALIASAGGLLLLESAERLHLRKRAIACASGAALLFSLAGLVRASSAYLILLITALFLIARFLPVKQWRRLIAGLLSVLVACGIVFALEWINESHYQQDGWQDFYPIFKASSIIREFGSGKIYSDLSIAGYKEIGWSPVDAELFHAWYILDSDKYSADKLIRLSRLTRANFLANIDLERAIQGIKPAMTDFSCNIMIAAIFLALFFLNRAKFSGASIVIFMTGLIAVCIFLMFWMKLPVRVFAGVITYTGLLCTCYLSPSALLNAFRPGQKTETNRLTVAAPIALCASAVMLVFIFVYWRIKVQEMHGYTNKFELALKRLAPTSDKLYVRWTVCLPTQYVRPFQTLENFANFTILPVGSPARSPFVLTRLKKFGIDDLLVQLDKKNVYFISEPWLNKILRSCLVRKYGKEPVFTPVFSDIFKVYKVEYVTATPSVLMECSSGKPEWDGE